MTAMLVTAGAAPADVPEGPRLAFVKFSTDPLRFELLTVDPLGALPLRVAGGGPGKRPLPDPSAGPSWGADGSLLAFGGLLRQGSVIYIANPDGSNARAVRGTRGGIRPVLSPDGQTLAFARSRLRVPALDPQHPRQPPRGGFFSTTVWLLDLDTGTQRRLTDWRNQFHSTPSSFSPDGSLLALTVSDKRGLKAIALRLRDGRATLLAPEAEDPVFSPDGSHLAFVSYRDRIVVDVGGSPMLAGELYVKPTDGAQQLRLTNTANRQESSPSWDPSGERLVYTQSSQSEALDFPDTIRQVNADGTCHQTLIRTTRGEQASFYDPAWQPGPAREAGRIVC